MLCYSAEFGVNGKQYTEVRGYAYGFQVRIEGTILGLMSKCQLSAYYTEFKPRGPTAYEYGKVHKKVVVSLSLIKASH